jgi:hypothetical protein
VDLEGVGPGPRFFHLDADFEVLSPLSAPTLVVEIDGNA